MKSPSIRLGELAHARSGDKGNHANIGVVAHTESGFAHLKQVLTVERLLEFFQPLGVTRIERFELPGIRALNFLLYDALAGGGSQSMRIDTQGKTLGQVLLELTIPCPEDAAATPPQQGASKP